MSIQSEHDIYREMVEVGLKGNHLLLSAVFVILIIAGFITFWAGISGQNPERAWQAYLVNLVFWPDLAFGAALFSAVITLTRPKLGCSIKRIAEAPGMLLPATFLLLGVIWFGQTDSRINPLKESTLPMNLNPRKIFFVFQGARKKEPSARVLHRCRPQSQ